MTATRLEFLVLTGLTFAFVGCPRSVPSGFVPDVAQEDAPTPHEAARERDEQDLPTVALPVCQTTACTSDADCAVGPGAACLEAACLDGCCGVVSSEAGTECELPCYLAAACGADGECQGLVALYCSPLDDNPCTERHCRPETGLCGAAEDPVADGTQAKGLSDACSAQVICTDGQPMPDPTMPSALSKECDVLNGQLAWSGCTASVYCDSDQGGCVLVPKPDATPCLPAYPPGPADACPGFACQAGECVSAPAFTTTCTDADYPDWCVGGCVACTELLCSWSNTPGADGDVLRTCTPEVQHGLACDDGEACTGNDVCADGQVVQDENGPQVWGSCAGTVNGDETLPDLILDGETVYLSGKHSFGLVKLINGAKIKVEPFDGEPCQPTTGTPGSGTLELEAIWVEVDKSSSIDAESAGGGGLGCAEDNNYTQNDSGAGGGYGGKGGTGLMAILEPGDTYGTADGPDIHMGSYGSTVIVAYSGCGPTGPSSGGAGGGLIFISACSVTVSGKLLANGEDGENGGPDDDIDGGGGGSGGGVLIYGYEVQLDGQIRARGGNGGHGSVAGLCSGWGGGGGGGGRIKVFADQGDVTGKLDASGGEEGPGTSYGATAGATGSVHVEVGSGP